MKKHAVLWLLFGISVYLSYLVFHPYWQYLFFACLLGILFAPTQRWLEKEIGRTASALVITIGIIALIVIPTLYIVATTVKQAPSAYQTVVTAFDKESIRTLFGVGSDEVRAFAIALGDKLRSNVLANAATYINQISNATIGLVILFMSLFFVLRDGKAIHNYLVTSAPVRRSYAEQFAQRMHKMINAVVIGQIVTAVVQGALVGIAFWVLGISNPLFWGVVATIASIIPVLGPLVVYIPASVYLFTQDRYIAGIFMILFGGAIISQVDNFLRPYITARTAQVHALIPIIGALGGLKIWGFVGFIVGPLALAATLVLYEFVVAESSKRTN